MKLGLEAGDPGKGFPEVTLVLSLEGLRAHQAKRGVDLPKGTAEVRECTVFRELTEGAARGQRA